MASSIKTDRHALAPRVAPVKPGGKKPRALPIRKYPRLFLIILAGTLLAMVPGSFLGLNFSGWGWFIPLSYSIYTLLRAKRRVTFPLLIWLPWIAFILFHLILTDFQAIQRTAQLIAPVVIGAAVSTLMLNERMLGSLNRIFRRFSLFTVFLMVANTGMLLTGVIPPTTGLAAGVMTTALLAVYFAASYAVRRKFIDLYYWCIMAMMPVFAVTRTAIAVTALTLPLTLGPIKPRYRIVISLLILVAAIGVFYTDRVQNKMFSQSGGQGEIVDLAEGNVSSSGRFDLWQKFEQAMERKPIWGYGAGTGEKFTLYISNGISQYPHNDYLLTRYDYGWVGLCLYLLTGGIMLWHALRKSLKKRNEVKILFLTGAGAFIPFWMLMGTDNIMVYAPYWGNLHFMILGLAYAATQNKRGTIRKRLGPASRLRDSRIRINQ